MQSPPPFFVWSAPAAAPAALTGFLRANGHVAINFDVSRYCVERLLTPARLASDIDVLAKGGRHRLPAYSRFLPAYLRVATDALTSAVTFGHLGRYHRARLAVELAARLEAQVFGESSWSSSGFCGNYDLTSPFDLLRKANTGGELPDDPIREAAVLTTDFRPDVVLISVAFPEQLYGALRFAYELKQVGLAAKVCLGGATVTRLRSAIPFVPELFETIDYVVIREGESRLLALVTALNENRDPLNSVSGLFACRERNVVESRAGAGEGVPFRPLSLPVFEDLVPGKYLSPAPFLPISTSRGCYYNQCAFCAIPRSHDLTYRSMKANDIAHQMVELHHQHPGAVFKDVSESLAPAVALRLADLLTTEEAIPNWECYLRFEKAFTRVDHALRLRAGGLRVAHLGLESASHKLLGRLNKGIEIRTAEQTIRCFADAGIWVHVFLISGLPGETEADHEMTLEFLRRNGSHIHSIQGSVFQMELESDVVSQGAEYGFTVRPRQEPSFSLTVEPEVRGQIPPHDVAQRRSHEIYELACNQPNHVLRESRFLWDAHKMFFAIAEGGPRLSGAENSSASFAMSPPEGA